MLDLFDMASSWLAGVLARTAVYMDAALLSVMEYWNLILCPNFQSTENSFFVMILFGFYRYSWKFEPVWKVFFFFD